MTSAGIRVRRSVWAATAVIAALILSACSNGAGTERVAPSSVPAASSEAMGLIPAIWKVEDAAGESPDTWIRFDSQVDLVRPKGDVFGEWTTQGDALLVDLDGWSMTLGRNLPKVPWLTSTTRFRRDGDGWTLTDSAGRRTARLVRAHVSLPSTHSLHTVPTLNASLRAQHADAVAGAGVRAVDPSAAIGTWGLPGIAKADGSVTLSAHGSWVARTSCQVLGVSDGGGGADRLLPTGVLLATERGVAGVGCDVPSTPPPADATAIIRFGEVGSVAIDGTRMTVYSRTGELLGRLTKKA